MRTLAILSLAFLVCSAVEAQQSIQHLIIVEVHTGTPDFVELHNPVTNGPVDPTGYTIILANNSACPSQGASNGPYTIVNPAGITLQPGDHYVIEDNGVAGVSLQGISGESAGINFSWAGGSHGEVALLDTAGLGVDYMQFVFETTPGQLGNSLDEGFFNNPRGALWVSTPITRPGGMDTLYRLNTPAGAFAAYTDTDGNQDWDVDATLVATKGLANPISASTNPAQVAGMGIDLEIENSATSFSLGVAVDNPAPLGGEHLWNLVSFSQSSCVGADPILGLEGAVLLQITLPLGTVPFHVPALAGSGAQSYLSFPFPLPPGLTLTVRSVILSGGGVALSNFVLINT